MKPAGDGMKLAGDGVNTLTVVIPVLDEEENIPGTFDELTRVLDALDGWRSEVIWIDDGSTDGSYEILKELPSRDPRHRVIRFRRNFGQTAALVAGFEHATGSVIVTLDGDLQNDPNDIPTLLAGIADGYDIVNGWRRKRHDTFLTRRLPSKVANWLISRVTGVHLHDYGCTLKAYRADVARNLSLQGDLHRFIPALASWYGVDVTEVEVNHRPRIHGKSKYGIGRTLRVIVDLMTVKFFLGYSARPGHLFGLVGLGLGAAGTVLMAYLGVARVFFGHPLAGRPALLLAILLAVLGLQFIGIGLLAEMIVRASRNGSRQQTYAIRSTVESAPDDVSDSGASASPRVAHSFSDGRIGAAEEVDDAARGARRE
jgi:glycosyltransferase involved in cell wall biosynthesis